MYLNGRKFVTRNSAWLVLLICTTWLLKAASAQIPRVTADRAALVAELTNIVGSNGWTADMGRMCVAMRLGSQSDCKFKQLSVSSNEPGTIDSHAFNVPLGNVGSVNYVVIFHLGALVGDFFVVSPDGELKAAFYRAKGTDYAEIPIQDGRRAFEASLFFWNENLTRIKEFIAKGNLPRK